MNIYLAHPIDQGRGNLDLRRQVDRAAGCLQDAGCTVYRPQDAFSPSNPLTAEHAEFIAGINRFALANCDGVFAILPTGTPTLGCPIEIEDAVAHAVPVAVWTNISGVVIHGWERRGAHVGTNLEMLVGLLTERVAQVEAEAVHEAQQKVALANSGYVPIPVVTLTSSEAPSWEEIVERAHDDTWVSSEEMLRDLEQRGFEQAQAQAVRPLWGSQPEAAPVIKWTGGGREPTKARPGDAGYDLYVSEHRVLMPGEFADIPCDVRIELPEGWWGLLTGRSSTLRRKGLLVAQGVIDQGYRGELFAGVKNLGVAPAEVKVGERIAQLIPMPLWQGGIERVAELGESERGERGFGSTGS